MSTQFHNPNRQAFHLRFILRWKHTLLFIYLCLNRSLLYHLSGLCLDNLNFKADLQTMDNILMNRESDSTLRAGGGDGGYLERGPDVIVLIHKWKCQDDIWQPVCSAPGEKWSRLLTRCVHAMPTGCTFEYAVATHEHYPLLHSTWQMSPQRHHLASEKSSSNGVCIRRDT